MEAKRAATGDGPGEQRLACSCLDTTPAQVLRDEIIKDINKTQHTAGQLTNHSTTQGTVLKQLYKCQAQDGQQCYNKTKPSGPTIRSLRATHSPKQHAPPNVKDH